MITPARALNGNGCPECHCERITKGKTRSHKWFVDTIAKTLPDIHVLGKYTNVKDPIRVRCTIHGYEWDSTPDNLLHGHGCKFCGYEKTSVCLMKPYEQYADELKQHVPTVICIGDYGGMAKPAKHRCVSCGYEWYTRPTNLINLGCGCPICTNSLPKTNESFAAEVQARNDHIEFIGEYLTAKTHALFRCKVCGNIWQATPDAVLSGSGCPRCCESHGERSIRLWLENNHIRYTTQKKYDDCVDERQLPFDFFLPDYNKLIEFDGEQHFRPVDFFGGEENFERTVRHDRIKTDYCIANNIDLLRIPYNKDINTELNNYIFAQ